MFWISSESVVMSPFSFLILLIRILSLCPLLVWLRVSLIFFYFLKEQAPCLVDSLYSSFCFYLVDFSPEFYYFLLSTPLGCICFFLFSCFVKLLVYAISSFFLEAFRAISFLLRNAFFVSHKFWYVMASFSLNSKKSLISSFIPSLTKVSLRSVVQFPRECWLSIIYFVIEDQP